MEARGAGRTDAELLLDLTLEVGVYAIGRFMTIVDGMDDVRPLHQVAAEEEPRHTALKLLVNLDTAPLVFKPVGQFLGDVGGVRALPDGFYDRCPL